jgi:hypothetical protein
MAWAAVAGAAIGLVGGAIAKNQANKGTQAQVDAQQQAIDEQRRQYDLTRSDLNPYMQFGGQAIPGLTALNNGDYSGFLNSPDYLAALNQGQGQIDHSAAARGGLFGGGHTKDTVQFGSDLASQYLGNYRNSLFQQAGMGQNAAAGLGGLGANMATNIGNAYGNMGDARASGYNNNAEFAAGAAGSLNGLFQNYAAQRQPTYGGGMSPGYGTGSGNYDWASTSGFGNNYGNF